MAKTDQEEEKRGAEIEEGEVLAREVKPTAISWEAEDYVVRDKNTGW